MDGAESIFARHARDYFARLGEVHLPTLAAPLGGVAEGDGLRLALLGRDYHVSALGVRAIDGGRVSYDACVILCRYVLMCPQEAPQAAELVTFRNLKDSGPLSVYFTANVEGLLATRFSGRLGELQEVCAAFGEDAGVAVNVDVAARFAALAKVPLVLLFNDRDDDFPASCTLLMERRAERYLDAECLAMLCHGLARKLAEAE